MGAVLRAKLFVSKVVQIGGTVKGANQVIQEQVELRAVYGEDGPNKQWAQWTPTALFEMTIDNPEAFGVLLPGQEYYVDLIPAEEGEGDEQRSINATLQAEIGGEW